MNLRTDIREPFAWACPVCRVALTADDEGNQHCSGCRRRFRNKQGIIDFLSELPLTDPKLQEVIDANQTVHDALGEQYEHDPQARQQFSSQSLRRLTEALQECLAGKETAILVDIGTGTGLALDCAKPLVQRSVGFDVSRTMLEHAKAKGHEVHLAPSHQLPLNSETADLVTIDSALHHFYDIASALAEAHRVLKPGGFLVTDWDANREVLNAEPNRMYEFMLTVAKSIRYFLNRWNVATADKDFELAEYHRFHGAELTSAGLRTSLTRAGFCGIQVFCHDNHPSIHRLSFWSAPPLSKARILVLMLLGRTTEKQKTYGNLMSVSMKPMMP
jgi:ubiquinone/menaquinone biosynthesis C-methylase UbiE